MKKPKRTNEIMKKVLLILFLVAIIIGVNFYITYLNTEEIKNEKFYQYFGTRKVEYEGNLTITKKGEITQLTCKDIQIQLDSTPIYYQESKNKVLFPQTMAQVTPIDNGKMTKIVQFSNIEQKEETMYLQSQTREEVIANSFLYDGGDLYFFIEEVTLTIGKENYRLSPLSYILASYQNGVEIYDYGKDEYIVIPTEEKVIVQADNYTIDTTVDTIKYGEKEQLLLRNIENL